MEDVVEGAQLHVHGDGVDLRLRDDCQQRQYAVIAEDPVSPRESDRSEWGKEGRRGLQGLTSVGHTLDGNSPSVQH